MFLSSCLSTLQLSAGHRVLLELCVHQTGLDVQASDSQGSEMTGTDGPTETVYKHSCSSTGRSQGPDRLLGLFFNGNLGSPLSDFTYGGMGGALGVGHSLALPGHGETCCQ